MCTKYMLWHLPVDLRGTRRVGGVSQSVTGKPAIFFSDINDQGVGSAAPWGLPYHPRLSRSLPLTLPLLHVADPLPLWGVDVAGTVSCCALQGTGTWWMLGACLLSGRQVSGSWRRDRRRWQLQSEGPGFAQTLLFLAVCLEEPNLSEPPSHL